MLTWGAFHIVGGPAGTRETLAREKQQVVREVQVEIDRLGVETDRDGWCPAQIAIVSTGLIVLVFSEWFVIDEAKIRTVYTAMFYPPPELAAPNWPPYNGNWPLPATTVPAPDR